MNTHELVTKDLDVSELRKEILEAAEEFDKYDFRRNVPGSPHTEMVDIWVRYNKIEPFIERGSFEGFADEHDSVWYEVVNKIPSVKKVIFDLMRIVDGERLGGVLITKLPPGGKIDKHTDAGWHASYYDKFYVPILNKKGACFCFNDGSIDPDYGDAWWFDNSQTHWVENNTDSDRIAMIVCIRTEKFVNKNTNRLK